MAHRYQGDAPPQSYRRNDMPRKAGSATVATLLLCLAVMTIASVGSTALAQEKPTTAAEMAKLFVVYRIPRDPAEFDRYYAQVHTPLVKKIPGLRRLEVTRLTGAPSGASDLYLIAELYF
jgi:EthD domain-containing protein